MNIYAKSNDLTDMERELLYGDAKSKNNIDDECHIHVTPKMQEIFTDNCEVQPVTIFRQKDGLCFKQVSIGECPVRKITHEEYLSFPDADKNKMAVVPRAMASNYVAVLSAAALILSWLLTMKTAINYGCLLATSVLPVIGVFLIMLFVFPSAQEFRKHLVKPDSQAAFGNVMLFHDSPEASGDNGVSVYFIDVAFYDERKLVRRVNCSRTVYKMLSLDSKVVVYGSNAYAYDQNGRLVG